MADGFDFTDNSAFKWISGFTWSALEGVPEVVGITPSTETLGWRQDHPVSSLVSEFAGMAVPYAGWYGALAKVPKLAKMAKSIDALGDAINNPITTRAKREVLKLAPFEAARVGVSQVLGDNTFGEEVSNSVLNLALTGGVGGLLGGLAAAGTREPTLPTIFPGIDIAAPAALQARHMEDILTKGAVPPELLPKANLSLKNALREARKEELPLTEKYVGTLMGDPVSHPPLKGLDQQLNRWFRPTLQPGQKSLQIRAFSNAADKNFGTAADWMAEADFIGLGKTDWSHGQYFRSIAFNPAKAGNLPKAVDNKFTKGFESIGDNWFLTREADDGMFVMAKKYIGEPGKGDPMDKWLLFKTDQPGHFVKDNQRWADAMVGLNKWIPESTIERDYGLVGNTLKGFVKEVPFRNYQQLGNNPKMIDQIINRLGPIGKDETANRLRDAFREYFVPRVYQFSKTPRANWISQASKVAYDYADNVANELMNGKLELDPGKQLFYGHLNSVTGPLGTTPIRKAGQALSQEEFANVFENFIRKGVPLEGAVKAHADGDLTDGGLEFLKALQAVDDITTSNVTLAENAVGKRPTEWMKGHYGWSHVWEGDTRIILKNPQGQTVFVAGGPNKRAAQKMADEMRAANPDWQLGEVTSKSEVMAKVTKGEVVPEDLTPVVLSPSFILERSGVGGYKWFNKTPKIDEFLSDYENMLRGRWRYQGNLATTDMLTPQLNRLERENSEAYKQVITRMNDDAGVPSKWTQAVNRFTDQRLAHIIGNESATKIVGYTNTGLMNFHLGAMNLSYPAVSLLTFIQTTIPEMAFVLGGMTERLAPYYSHFLAGGSRGPVGAMAVLQPLKLVGRAIKEMIKPSADVSEAVAWGLNNRTLEPRMVEGYIGEAATKVADIKSVLKGDASFGSWVRALSEWLPANSERISRTHTYIMGYLAARDILLKNGQRLTKEQMYRFTKQFTDKTMYLYSTADKPRVLTSPVGSGLGLFKNWMFNYMGSMGQYTGLALKGNVAPLAWQTAGTFAIGGLSATPIYWAADIFAKAFTGNDALTVAYDELGDGADGMMFGLPALLSGVSFYSQVQAPGANPSRDAVSMFSSVVWDRMRATGAAFSGAFDHWQATGNHPGSDPNVRLQMAKAFLPTTLYRTMSTQTDGTVLSATTGYPIIKDLSIYEQMLYRLKLNPVDIDKAMAVSNRLYAQREERRATVAQLGEAFTNAQIKGDSAEMALIMRQAMVWGIDGSSVLRSAMARLSKHQEDMITRGYKPSDIARYRSVLER